MQSRGRPAPQRSGCASRSCPAAGRGGAGGWKPPPTPWPRAAPDRGRQPAEPAGSTRLHPQQPGVGGTGPQERVRRGDGAVPSEGETNRPERPGRRPRRRARRPARPAGPPDQRSRRSERGRPLRPAPPPPDALGSGRVEEGLLVPRVATAPGARPRTSKPGSSSHAGPPAHGGSRSNRCRSRGTAHPLGEQPFGGRRSNPGAGVRASAARTAGRAADRALIARMARSPSPRPRAPGPATSGRTATAGVSRSTGPRSSRMPAARRTPSPTDLQRPVLCRLGPTNGDPADPRAPTARAPIAKLRAARRRRQGRDSGPGPARRRLRVAPPRSRSLHRPGPRRERPERRSRVPRARGRTPGPADRREGRGTSRSPRSRSGPPPVGRRTGDGPGDLPGDGRRAATEEPGARRAAEPRVSALSRRSYAGHATSPASPGPRGRRPVAPRGLPAGGAERLLVLLGGARPGGVGPGLAVHPWWAYGPSWTGPAANTDDRRSRAPTPRQDRTSPPGRPKPEG